MIYSSVNLWLPPNETSPQIIFVTLTEKCKPTKRYGFGLLNYCISLKEKVGLVSLFGS